MTIESGNTQEASESGQGKRMKVVRMTGQCPACRNGMVDTWYYEGEIGFKDTCEICDFEGINITEWFQPPGQIPDMFWDWNRNSS